MKVIKLFGHLLIILLLTVLTQIGGLVWVLALLISVKLKKKKRYVFIFLYLLFNLFIIPPAAKYFGREKLPVFSKIIKPRNLIYPLLFRNYVTPSLKSLIISSSEDLKRHNIVITYLDANFPFFDGFLLLPHLSHSDGKKIDVSFMYLDKDGKSTDKKPSVSGYGAFVNPVNETLANCLQNGYWQYDFTKYLTFGTYNNIKFDKAKTKLLIQELLSHNNTEKLFIEPYLKQELGLYNETKIRFQGCQAVRHDDHIHLQVK